MTGSSTIVATDPRSPNASYSRETSPNSAGNAVVTGPNNAMVPSAMTRPAPTPSGHSRACGPFPTTARPSSASTIADRTTALTPRAAQIP